MGNSETKEPDLPKFHKTAPGEPSFKDIKISEPLNYPIYQKQYEGQRPIVHVSPSPKPVLHMPKSLLNRFHRIPRSRLSQTRPPQYSIEDTLNIPYIIPDETPVPTAFSTKRVYSDLNSNDSTPDANTNEKSFSRYSEHISQQDSENDVPQKKRSRLDDDFSVPSKSYGPVLYGCVNPIDASYSSTIRRTKHKVSIVPFCQYQARNLQSKSSPSIDIDSPVVLRPIANPICAVATQTALQNAELDASQEKAESSVKLVHKSVSTDEEIRSSDTEISTPVVRNTTSQRGSGSTIDASRIADHATPRGLSYLGSPYLKTRPEPLKLRTPRNLHLLVQMSPNRSPYQSPSVRSSVKRSESITSRRVVSKLLNRLQDLADNAKSPARQTSSQPKEQESQALSKQPAVIASFSAQMSAQTDTSAPGTAQGDPLPHNFSAIPATTSSAISGGWIEVNPTTSTTATSSSVPFSSTVTTTTSTTANADISAIPAISKSLTAPQFNFAFGGVSKSADVTLTSAAASTTTTAATIPTFQFGGQGLSKSVGLSIASNTTSTSFSFGSKSGKLAVTSSAVSGATPVFSFGASATAPIPSVAIQSATPPNQLGAKSAEKTIEGFLAAQRNSASVASLFPAVTTSTGTTVQGLASGNMFGLSSTPLGSTVSVTATTSSAFAQAIFAPPPTTGAFSFGPKTDAKQSFGVTTTTALSSVTSTPSFFATTSASGFSFAPSAAAATTSKTGIFVNPAFCFAPAASTTTTTTTASIQFGATVTAAPTTTSTSIFAGFAAGNVSASGTIKPFGQSASTPSFSFGNPTTTATASTFSFGTKPAQSAFGAAPAVTTSATQPIFNFGSQQKVASTAPPSLFQFGAAATTTTTAAASSMFGTQSSGQGPAAAPVFAFGQTAKTTAPSFNFGNAPPVTTAAPSFAFGQKAPAPTTAPGLFAFGQTQPASVTSAPSFNFGAAAQSSSTASSGNVAAPGFNFGGASAAPGFNFGQQVPSAAPAFGQQVASPPTFNFGAAAAAAPSLTATPNMFNSGTSSGSRRTGAAAERLRARQRGLKKR